MSHHLFLLSPSDTPLYTLTHYSTKPAPSTTSPLSSNLPNWSTATHHSTGGAVRMGGGQDRHVIQMIANASLDMIEDVMRKENTMYLKAVDKFNEWTVSAFITPGRKNDDGIRQFFMEGVGTTMLNPFHTAHTTIRSGIFDARVRGSAKKYL
ncbi:Sedlin [Lyophyllum atratum]|nr:Sedlin [Lyophyllum atratum]